MIAYNKTSLYNLVVQSQAKDAKEDGNITALSFKNILHAHPVDFYSPNIFMQIGMSILTFIIILAFFGLFFLLLNLNTAVGEFTVFTGVACYFMLEFLTRQKKHYNSGVDNMLMAAVPLLIVTGIGINMNNGEQLLSFLFCIICTFQAIRFTDRLMALAAAISFLVFIFNVYSTLGEFTISSFPYVLVVASAALYLLAKKFIHKDSHLFYYSCWAVVEIVGLVSFYASGNYFVIDSISNDAYLLQKESALQWPYFIWLWTFGIPIVYIVNGIIKKDLLTLRLGIIFTATAIITYRHYHAIMPIEFALTIAGSLVLGTAYWLTKYLKKAKHGFVFSTNSKTEDNKENLEGYILSEAFAEKPVPVEETGFGGGTFGGAGAGSNY